MAGIRPVFPLCHPNLRRPDAVESGRQGRLSASESNRGTLWARQLGRASWEEKERKKSAMFCPVCGGDDNTCTCASTSRYAQVGGGDPLGGEGPHGVGRPHGGQGPADLDQLGGPAALLQFLRDFTETSAPGGPARKAQADPSLQRAGRGPGVQSAGQSPAGAIDARFAMAPAAPDHGSGASQTGAPLAAPPVNRPPVAPATSGPPSTTSIRIAPFAALAAPLTDEYSSADDEEREWWE